MSASSLNKFGSRSEWKRSARLFLGKWTARFLGYAAEYAEELRCEALAGLCRAHPTASIFPSAGINNAQGKPDSITIDADSAILGELVVLASGGHIRIGKKTFVGPGSRIWSAASVSIGDHVLISHNVNVHDNISHSLDIRERRKEIDAVLPNCRLTPHTFEIKAEPLVIESDAWIGFGASIIGGVRIGRGAIVGAGTMVTKDVDAFTVVVGNPMRVVKKLPRD